MRLVTTATLVHLVFAGTLAIAAIAYACYHVGRR